MIFVDANAFIYAVGNAHPLRARAREFFSDSIGPGNRLCTSAEVLQELAYVYMRTNRVNDLDNALGLVRKASVEVWPLEEDDVLVARQLFDSFPEVEARDLCHLASCQRRGVDRVFTFDKEFGAIAAQSGLAA